LDDILKDEKDTEDNGERVDATEFSDERRTNKLRGVVLLLKVDNGDVDVERVIGVETGEDKISLSNTGLFVQSFFFSFDPVTMDVVRLVPLYNVMRVRSLTYLIRDLSMNLEYQLHRILQTTF